MSERKPASLARISDAVLVDIDGNEHRAAELWQSQPAIILLVQRPGCVLCRAHARRLWSLKESLDELGMKPICLVHEWVKPEIAAFKKDNWAGDLLLDKDKLLYKALGDGKLRRQSYFTIMRNFPALRKKVRAAQKEAPGIGKITNLKGDKTVLGGVMVVKAGAKGVQYMYAENAPGDQPPLDKVLESCEAASGKHTSIHFSRIVSMRSCSSEACSPRSLEPTPRLGQTL